MAQRSSTAVVIILQSHNVWMIILVYAENE